MKRTTRITVETRRVLVISGGGGFTLQWCATCDHEVMMLPPQDASAVANVHTRLVYQWVERGLVHFSEAPDGLLLICVNSLPETYGCETPESMPHLDSALNTGPQT